MSTSKENEYCGDLNKLEEKLEKELKTIRSEVDDLYETVYKGNGHPSLVTRVNGVESKLRGLRDQMDEKISHLSREHNLRFDSIHQKLESKFGRLEGWIETKFENMESMVKALVERQRIDRSGGWQFKAALLTAGTAIIATILTYFLK